MDLKSTIAIVTGAGRGIGRAIAIRLAREGVSTVLAARTQSDVEGVAEEITGIGGRALPIRADVTLENDVGDLVRQAQREFGKIDILVNNAGIGHFHRVEEMPVPAFDAMWNVNMRGVFLMTRAVLPGMLKRETGDIVNVASLAGRNAFIGGAGYAATKWALIGFSRSLMLEVREKNIRVITICPGSVSTDFAGPSEIHKIPGVIPSGEEIAEIIANTLKMPRHVMVSEIDVRPTNPAAKAAANLKSQISNLK